MTRKDIITMPHGSLRERSTKISEVNDEIKQLSDNMTAATLDWEDTRPNELGVALAAVQVNRLYRMVVVRNDFDNKKDRSFLTLLNPKIIRREGEPILGPEGCLSVADVYAMVPRYPKIRLEAQTLDGETVRLDASDFLARVLQHEIDHCNGTLFIDHVADDQFLFLQDNGELVDASPEQVTKVTAWKKPLAPHERIVSSS